MYKIDHLNLHYIDHFEPEEAGKDCSITKNDHGMLD